MERGRRPHPVVGVLAGWQVYDRSVLLNYHAPLLRGISAAARDHECGLLLACGVNLAPMFMSPHALRPAWPAPLPDADFVPAGPWNTDGLIVVNPLPLQPCQSYIQELIAGDFPVVYVGAGYGGPAVGIDNAGGIRQALEHLAAHGHRSIAFIAGLPDDEAGDSGQRLRAYQETVRALGLGADPRLIAYGLHRFDRSRDAMRQILVSGVAFTAVLGSSDEGAIGALEVLQAAGLRVPEDVAVAGFDDVGEALVQDPPLTSLHSPTFQRGYRALELALDHIRARRDPAEIIKVPARLVVRRSCGCVPRGEQPVLAAEGPPPVGAPSVHEPHPRPLNGAVHGALAPAVPPEPRTQEPEETAGELDPALPRAMADAVLGQLQHVVEQAVVALCRRLAASFRASLEAGGAAAFYTSLEVVLRALDAAGEEVERWQGAISILRAELPVLLAPYGGQLDARALADAMLDDARAAISEAVQRQYRSAVIAQRQTADRMGLLSARLLTSTDESQILQIVRDHLPELGIGEACLAFFEPEGDDRMGWSMVHPLSGHAQALRAPTRAFPPPELYPPAQPFQLALLPLLAQDGPVGYVAFDTTRLDLYGAIVHQLTAGLQSIRLYRQANEGRRLAEEANRIKSRFLSSVSHELRTPLNLIGGLSKMVLEAEVHGETGLSPTSRQDLERIHASAQHLDGLIRDVLDMAQSEVGQLRLTCEPVDLGEALQVALLVGEQLARDKRLGWRVEVAPDLPPVLGDRTRLRQILLNLVGNAVKFTERGEIGVRVERRGRHVAVCVSDTGVGIPPKDRAAIFDEFRQSKRTSGRGFGGLGLGLAIARRLVEMHGGQLQVQSSGEAGVGSTFWFTLPALAEAMAGDEAPPAHDGGDKTILLVDDEAAMLDLHGRAIASLSPDYHVLRADNGRQALEMIRERQPDLVLLDLRMPELDGFEVLEALRDQPATRSLPVIILTAQVLDEADMARLNRGVATVLEKGVFNIEETLAHVERVLARSRKLGGETQRLVRRAIAYIHAHYADPLSRDEIAYHLGVNKDYLTRCFSQEMGISLVTYLNRYRVKQAKLLLASGAHSITEIASAVGFADSNYFSRVFRRETGHAPREYQV